LLIEKKIVREASCPTKRLRLALPGGYQPGGRNYRQQLRPHKALRGAIARKPIFYKGVGHVDNVDNLFLVDSLQVWGAVLVGHVDNLILGGGVGHVDNLFLGCPHDPQREGKSLETKYRGRDFVGHVDNVDKGF